MRVQKEPLLSTSLPSHPWEKLAMDLFNLKGKSYILLVDYHSRFVEVQELKSTTTSSVISFLKPILARYGIPVTLVSACQWATIHFYRNDTICRNIWISSHYHQSLLPTGKWPG